MQEPVDREAHPPERFSSVPTIDGELALYEWGHPDAPPLVLVHGFLDHGRGFDRLAPHLMADYRVVAFDARGHGRSARAESYGWENDVQDLARVIDFVGGSADLIAHSRGGGQALDASIAYPKRVHRVVDIDGFGPPPDGWETVDGVREDPPARDDLLGFLDRRRAAAMGRSWPTYPSFEALVERRGKQNPRLDPDWLRYFVFHAAKQTEDGWTWRADSHVTLHAGPWDVGWITPTWRSLRVPILAITGTERDAWGPASPELVAERLGDADYEHVTIPDTGHFVHMERPREVAEAALGWLKR